MAADETTICNLALGKLGQRSIMSLDDDSPAARACKQFYAQTRDIVLQASNWRFAIKRANLPRLVDAPVSDWAFQYQLPADYLKISTINGKDINDLSGFYEIEGRLILTDYDKVVLKYVRRVEDANLYSPLFIEALATKLAAEISKPITGSASEKQALISESIRIAGPEARRANATEGKPKPKQPWEHSYLVASRFQ